jgi:hypothetical protein
MEPIRGSRGVGRVVIGARALLFAGALTALGLQAAAAAQSTVLHMHTIGNSIIHGGPTGPDAVTTNEIRPEADDIGVKAQSPQANVRHGGLAIPSKEAGRRGLNAFSKAAVAANSPMGAALPPPPTTIPDPKGRKVVDSSSSVFGFMGLTHLDQRVAGTGIYTNTQFSLEPPDQGLCVGGGFVVEIVNNAIAVYDTHGNQLAGPEAMSQFFGFAPEINRLTGVTGPFISDPKCVYDPDTERWFVTELAQDTGTNPGASGRNYNVIAVSVTSDPRGEFLVLAYDVTDDGLNGTPNHATCPCFGDQPLLGFDRYGIYQSTNEFSATAFNGSQVYAIPKDGLIDATAGDFSELYVVAIDASAALLPYGGLSYSIQPAVGTSRGQGDDEESSERGVEFFLSALQFGAPPYQLLDNRIAVWALTNTRSLTTNSPALTLTFDVIASETYGQPNPAQQKPGPTPLGTSLGDSLEFLNTNDDRMNQVVYSGGKLYSAVNTIIGDGSRTGIAWFAVQPELHHNRVSGRVVDQGYVAVDGENVIFPSVAVGGSGSGLIGFTLVGADYYPSAAFVKLGDDAGRAVHIAANGQLPDDGFSGYPQYSGGNVGRWGDYSAAVSDGRNVWFAAEYIPNAPRTLLANWGTWVAKVKLESF